MALVPLGVYKYDKIFVYFISIFLRYDVHSKLCMTDFHEKIDKKFVVFISPSRCVMSMRKCAGRIAITWRIFFFFFFLNF